MYGIRSRYFSETVVQRLNQELVVNSHRARKGCFIASFGIGEEAPGLFYTDGRGFLLAECVLRTFEADFPFHDTEMGVLNFLNICPIQLGANGWRMLRAFISKCLYEGVEPTVPMFFYLFHSGWHKQSFVSFHRRPNRPQILEPCVSHPKGWQDRFVLIRGDDGVRPWWVREEDDRPKFPLRWRRPRTGVRVSDWEDLTVKERLGVLRLATSSPIDPEGIHFYSMISYCCFCFLLFCPHAFLMTFVYTGVPPSMGSLMRRGKKKAASSVAARPTTTSPRLSPAAARPAVTTTTRRPILPPFSIRDSPPPQPTPEPASADSRGKRPMISGEDPPSKKARSEGIPLVPPFPATQDFNPFAVLEEIWSPEAAAERDRYVEESRKEENDPAILSGKYLLAAAQTLQAAYVSRLDLLAERNTVIADLASAKRRLSAAESDNDLLKASKESLQLSFDQSQGRAKEQEKELAVAVTMVGELQGQLKMASTKVGELQEQLRRQEETAKEEASAPTRQWLWTFKRFGYQCFRNAVAQLKVRNPHLDTSAICPNKEVFNVVIRDRLDSDPEGAAFPPIPETFGQEGYESPGDDEFPYYEDPSSQEGEELIPDGGGAEEVGEPPAEGNAGEAAPDTSAATE